MPWSWILVSAVALAALISTGCGGHPVVPGLTHAAAGFTLNVLPESFLGTSQTGAFQLNIQQEGADLVVEVSVRDAEDLKAAFFELHYDELRWHVVNVASANAWGADLETLELAYLDTAGVVHYGQVVARYEEMRGLSGGAVLARLRFASGAAPITKATRAPGGPPTGAAPLLVWYDQEEPVLHWRWGGPGDYDQNGETNAADLAPLAKHFRKTGPFMPLTQLAAVDGDGNSEINAADIVTIAGHFGEKVEGYEVSTIEFGGEAGGPLVKARMLGWSTGADGVRLGRFDMIDDFGAGLPGPPEESNSIWHIDGVYVCGNVLGDANTAYTFEVVPFVGSEQGVASNQVGGPPAELIYSFEPPVQGTGRRTDPFIVETPPANDPMAVLSLMLTGEGDVTQDYDMRTFGESFPEESCQFAPPGLPPSVTGAVTWTTGPGGLSMHVNRSGPAALWGGLEAVAAIRGFIGDPSRGNAPVSSVKYLLVVEAVDPGFPLIAAATFENIPKRGQVCTVDASETSSPDILFFEFEVEGVGTFGPQEDPTFSFLCPDETDITVRVRVISETGAEACFTLRSHTLPPGGDEPQIALLDPEPGSTCVRGQQQYFRCQVSDDEELKECRWYADLNGEFDPAVVDLAGQTHTEVECNWTPLDFGSATVTCEVEDKAGNVAMLEIPINVLDSNMAPTANLIITPSPTFIGADTLLDATGSTDFDGTVEQVWIDVGDDGSYEYILTAPQEFKVTHVFSQQGFQPIKAVVYDDQGQENLNPASFGVLVQQPLSWQSQILSIGSKGKHCSLANIGGMPAIAFYDEAAGDLGYIRATDNQGSSWGVEITATNTPLAVDGLYPSMPSVSARAPFILFYDQTNTSLMCVPALNDSGSAWFNAPALVDGALGETGKGVSAQLVPLAGGNPAALYYREDGAFYTRATDTAGLSWGAPVQIAVGVADADPQSRLIVPLDGNPQAVYTLDSSLWIATAQDNLGAAWGPPVQIETLSKGGTAITDWQVGSPVNAAVYASLAEMQLKQPVGGDPADWSGPTIAMGAAGTQTVRISGYRLGQAFWGEPRYVIAAGAEDGLRVYISADAAGQSWIAPFVLSDVQSSGQFGLSMNWAPVTFVPMLAWYDADGGWLMFSVLK